MKAEQQKITIMSAFKDGNLIPATEQDEEITKEAVFFPDNVGVGKVSIGMDQSIKIYGFGGNAKVSVHVSIPFALTGSELTKATEFATSFCESKIVGQVEQYKQWLESCGIDWKKIEAMK